MTTQEQFVLKYYPEALKTQVETGITATAVLTQAALESGWGKYAVGNNFFGIKDTDGLNGNEQLITTTEYLTTPLKKFPQIISVVQVVGKRLWKYVVKDYFRAYKTPSESFTDHTKFFFQNKRYKVAVENKADTLRFLQEVAKAGYATAPNYYEILEKLANQIDTIIKKLKSTKQL